MKCSYNFTSTVSIQSSVHLYTCNTYMDIYEDSLKKRTKSVQQLVRFFVTDKNKLTTLHNRIRLLSFRKEIFLLFFKFNIG